MQKESSEPLFHFCSFLFIVGLVAVGCLLLILVFAISIKEQFWFLIEDIVEDFKEHCL